MASRSSAYFHLLSSYFLAPAAVLEAWTCGPLTGNRKRKQEVSDTEPSRAGRTPGGRVYSLRSELHQKKGVRGSRWAELREGEAKASDRNQIQIAVRLVSVMSLG